MSNGSRTRPPWGLKWRASYWFVTFVVSLGISVDLLVYSIVIPVLPFNLEALGYSDPSSLTAWLLVAYSGGLAITTIPAAMFSERYHARKYPLILGIFLLIGSQIMLMLAPTYWLMCLARILQGLGSTMVWVVGLALLCDSTPPQYIGKQLGLTMSGLTVGFLIGPSVGGALYTRFGFHGPFIFGIVASVIDLIARLMIIERKDAILFGFDPAATVGPQSTIDEEEKPPEEENTPIEDIIIQEQSQSLLSVFPILLKSSRVVIVFVITFLYGIIYTAQEPTISLHLQDVWGLNSSKVGLVFLGSTMISIFSAPLSGWYADKKGPEWITFWCLLLTIPWWGLLILQVHIALFIVSFIVQSFFLTAVLTPAMSELATVSRGTLGIGYAHVYGAFNFAYALGTCIGPIIGGQIYDHVHKGWMVICILSMGVLVVCVILAAAYVGDNPLLRRMFRTDRKPSSSLDSS